MSAHRLYIASVEADALEKTLAFDPAFFIVGSGQDAGARREIEALCPDAVVMDCVLSGADGQDMLRALGHTMPAPPRALLLQRGMTPTVQADGVCPYPCEEAALRQAVHAVADKLLPALAAPWQADREEIAKALLDRLNVPAGMKGYAYLRRAAADCACAPNLMNGKRLYSYVGQMYHASPAAVEKAVRAAVERTWLKGDLTEIQRLFGLSVDAEKGKPTNLECVAMLAEHTRRLLQKRMLAAKTE